MVTLVQLRVIDAVRRHGSVTKAGKELRYTQPAISHHLSRLETELGAQLVQRVGRGIRLTPAGRLLAERAAEIIGRVDSATTELSALVGLNAGRVRLAGFNSVMSSLVPQAGTVLAEQHPGLELGLTDTHPEEALQQLRAGHVDVAIIFRYDDTTPEDDTVRLTHLLDDPLYLLTTSGGTTLADHAGTVDRRLRTLPQPPRRDVPGRRLLPTPGKHHRRHGRHAKPRRRRHGRHHHPRTGPPRPPTPRDHRHPTTHTTPPDLRRHLRRTPRPTRHRRTPRRPHPRRHRRSIIRRPG
jgi:DNA-binding transcriptional LysR family regulator